MLICLSQALQQLDVSRTHSTDFLLNKQRFQILLPPLLTLSSLLSLLRTNEQSQQSAPMANSGGEKKDKLKLYSYWRSSCSHRVRIALGFKGVDYEYIPVDVFKGDQFKPDFQKMNPMGAVPVLADGDVVISDSLAIILYLDEKYPEPPLLPSDLHKRAVNYQATSIILSSLQPHQNMAFLIYIEEKTSTEEKNAWVNKAFTKGFTALEKLLVNHAGKYATGDEVSLADLFLAPQIDGAINKFKINMDPYLTLAKCYKAYNDLPAFQEAVPEKQPDAPATTT